MRETVHGELATVAGAQEVRRQAVPVGEVSVIDRLTEHARRVLHPTAAQASRFGHRGGGPAHGVLGGLRDALVARVGGARR